MNGYLFSQKKAQIRIALALIIVVTVIPFLSSLDNDFTNWDDDKYVTGNYAIRNLSWLTLKTIFTSFYIGTYCPLVILSYTLEYALFGLNPLGYHLTNLLLHIGNTLLVFALVLRLSTYLLPAFVAALLFGVHPLHVESVAWVTERKDVLSTLFFLGSVFSYLRYQEDRQARFYALSLMAFGLSLLSKPMGVTLPLILLLCDYLCARAWSTRTLVEKVPFLGLSALFSVITFLAQHSGGAIKAARFPALGDNVLVACWGVVFYLSKTLAPVKLSAFYPYPSEISLGLPAFFLPPILLLALAAGVWISRRYTRAVVFGSLFFLVTLLPVLKIVPIGETAAADRYMYIPSIGLFYLVGMTVYHLYIWPTRWTEVRKGAVGLMLGAVIVTLSVLTWQRCNVWQDNETLWLNVLKHYPDVPDAHISLGATYNEKGRTDAAIAHYQQALASDPNNALAHYNLGNAYQKKGWLDAAITEYQKALTPTYAWAHHGLGTAYEKKGLFDAAIAEYYKALAIDPNDALVHYNLGNAYQKKGLLDAAITEYQKALTLNLTYALAHNNLGAAYAEKGLFDAAIAEYQQALTLDPTYALPHYNLALTYFHKGSHQEAIKHYDRARELGYSGNRSLAEALAPHRQAP